MIRMVPISKFTEGITAKVGRSMPQANIEDAAREAVIYFLMQSRAAVSETYLTVECGEVELSPHMVDCRRLIQYESIWVAPTCAAESRWTPAWTELHHSDINGGGWWVDDVDGMNETIWLAAPLASTAQKLCIRYSWKPGRDAACEVPAWLYEDYAPAIVRGALAWLLANPVEKDSQLTYARLLDSAMMEDIAFARRRKEAQYRSRKLTTSVSHFLGG
jgi:hypothetical protein